MRKKPIYTQSSVTYWPGYMAVPVGVTLLSIYSIASLIIAGISIFEGSAIWVDYIMLVSFPICIYFISKIKGLGHKKVTINQQGITIFGKNETKDLIISWSDVDEIKYEHSDYKGWEWFVITYKLSNQERAKQKQLCLPLSFVETGKIVQIIPLPIGRTR